MSGARKLAKIHPFFSKPSASSSTAPSFQWLKPALGPKRTCLHGINLIPQSTPKVAAFDLDGTVIKSNHKNRSREAALHWEWWRACVPVKLEELHQEGYSIILVSNQALKQQRLEDWKKKIPLISAALPSVPFRIFAASAKDGFRKPMPGMWDELERIFAVDGIQIGESHRNFGCIANILCSSLSDKEVSFFVGDAAGRTNDFASTDRKWAFNIGISFFTPEEYFLQLPSAPYTLPSFHVSSLPKLPLLDPPIAQIIPDTAGTELVVFSGFPCLGKSSFFRRHFAPAGYTHINQDTLGSRSKCVKAAEVALKAGTSCVIDNTNRDIATRKYYLDLAKKLELPVRCIVFIGSIDLAWHNNLYRAYVHPSTELRRDILPYFAFIGFKDNYEEPQVMEGFSEIIKVNWVFEGCEEERRRWSMRLQIDGK
ncbi:polynucleotide kinase 3 phosphatase-domain-containing protein [Suillus clintonianus]|uniref:polynucleotide kinase 3 phosphatase-domain-containing protein n=1 Tax=Suillus clintonianus TaxID=1904413 RepID=UPI001B8739E2|nr:polynucleotide kinase 3 phosphatase-domain-containing protein [Suillus clintonianus]KAG2149258.1 polynucleotide kinase 3 phosphatase-domain-containing protein [Suillus clintonianus]